MPSGSRFKLEPGVSITYSGQFEYMERANARLKVVVPATLLIIFVLLYLTFARVDEAGLIMATLPFALTGGIWFLVPAETTTCPSPPAWDSSRWQVWRRSSAW